MNKGKFTRIMSLVVVAAMLLTLVVGVAGAQDMKTIRFQLGYDDTPTMDPALATDSASIQSLIGTYPGMTILNEETLAVEPGIASSWDVSDDGLTYTFHLMDNIPWVKYNADTEAVEQVMDDSGNPRMVTAQDVVYGIMRSLNPDTAADYAYVDFPVVVGASDYNSGSGSADAVGVSALDDHTVQIVSPNAAGYASNIYGMWINRPQPQWAIEANGDSWIEPENFVSYGPFAMKDWEHGDHMTLIKNPFWPGTDNIPQSKLDEVELDFVIESTAMSSYEAGEIDVLSAVPIQDLDRIQADPVLSEEYHVQPQPATYYYGFNVTKTPIDNVHIRRALSLAVDRQGLIDNVVKGGQTPAQWFTSPAVAAAPTLETSPDLGVKFNPDQAMQELQMGLDDMGLADVSELPPITLMHNQSEAHAAIAQAIQQMWAQYLGLNVQIATQEWGVYLSTLDEDPPQIFRLGWSQDYPDANNFASDVFLSTSGNNHTKMDDPKYDDLVTQASLMTDVDARRALYEQSEEILVWDDAAIIPLYWYTNSSLTKPNVVRTYALDANERFEKWDLTQ
jgi:oligopeptide transport system substrate-binding protein